MAPIPRWLGRSERAPSRLWTLLTVATAVTTYLLIVAGGVVRTSGSGLGCGASGGRNDWPFCQGRLLPPLQREAVIEFSHRWLAALVVGGALAVLAVAWARYRHLRALAWTSTGFTALLIVQVVLGAVTVYARLPGDVVMVHLANAELLLGCAILLVVLGRTGGRLPRAASVATTGARRRAAAWAGWAAVATYALVLSGAFVVARGAGPACDGWPLCGGGARLDGSELATYNLGHRVVAGVVSVLLGVAVMRSARAFAGARPVRIAGIAVAVLLLAQVVAGAVLVESRLPAATRSLHEALASALWAAVITLALLVRPGVLGLAPGDDPGSEPGGERLATRGGQPAATPGMAAS